MIKKEDLVKIGYFSKPHGIKGEINLVTTSNLLDGLDEPYIICEMEGIPVPFFIEEYRYKSDTIILVKLENVDSEEAAREFINHDVYYPLSAIPDNDLIGDVTWDSFIGYTVSDEKHGNLGEITNVDESTINVLLEINYKGNELLLPAADELITSVDHTKKHMTVSIPDGLLDI